MKAQYHACFHVLLQLTLTFDPHWKRVHCTNQSWVCPCTYHPITRAVCGHTAYPLATLLQANRHCYQMLASFSHSSHSHRQLECEKATILSYSFSVQTGCSYEYRASFGLIISQPHPISLTHTPSFGLIISQPHPISLFFNPIHPTGNSLKKQKPCTKVQRLVLKPPYKIP